MGQKPWASRTTPGFDTRMRIHHRQRSESALLGLLAHLGPFVLSGLPGCGAPASEPVGLDAETSFLAGDRLGELPESLAELGLYPDPANRREPHPEAIPFVPAYALWTNGATKERLLLLPPGTSVDTASVPWRFPLGAILSKTFSYPGEGDTAVPVETRILRRGADGWDYAVYSWNAEGTGALLLDGGAPVSVPITLGDERFEHVVPSRLQCRSCHESAPGVVLGFDELRLAVAPPGESETPLEDMHGRGVLSELPPDPERLTAADDLTRSVLGYFEGNCTHCHNGGEGPASAFSLRHPVALENVIDVEATSELVGGWRVQSGAPEQSGLFLALSRAEVTTAQPMPPLGVERLDVAAVEMFRTWIAGLPGAPEAVDQE